MCLAVLLLGQLVENRTTTSAESESTRMATDSGKAIPLLEAEDTARRLDALEKVLDHLIARVGSKKETDGNINSSLFSPKMTAVGLVGCLANVVGIAVMTDFDVFSAAASAATCLFGLTAAVLLSIDTTAIRSARQSCTGDLLKDPLIVSWLTSCDQTSEQEQETHSLAPSAYPSSPSSSEETYATNEASSATMFEKFDTCIKDFDVDGAAKALDSIPTTTRIHGSAMFFYRRAELEMMQAGRFEDQSEEQKNAYDRAYELAERAYSLDSSCAKVNVVLASVLGLKMPKISDQKEKINAVWRLLELCDSAIKGDPNLPTPYHIKGRLQLQVSSIGSALRYGAKWIDSRGIPEATLEDALANLLLAEKLMKPRFWHTNELMKAKCYAGMRDNENARKSAQAVLSIEMNPRVYSRNTADRLRRSARKLL